MYYELSLRHAIGKPAIHMALEGTPLSFDLRDNRTIFYTMHCAIAESAREQLSSQVRRVREPGYKATNPIVETAGIIKLEQSPDPDEHGREFQERKLNRYERRCGTFNSDRLEFISILTGASLAAGTAPMVGGIIGGVPYGAPASHFPGRIETVQPVQGAVKVATISTDESSP